jgi:hypothetical protein
MSLTDFGDYELFTADLSALQMIEQDLSTCIFCGQPAERLHLQAGPGAFALALACSHCRVIVRSFGLLSFTKELFQ